MLKGYLKDGTIIYGPGGYRRETMTRLGWKAHLHFTSVLLLFHLSPIGRLIRKLCRRQGSTENVAAALRKAGFKVKVEG